MSARREMEVRQGAILLVVLLTSGAFAAEQAEQPSGLRYSLSAGVTHTDNAGRSSTNRESEDVLEIGLAARMAYRRERQSLNLDADLQYQKRTYGTYGSGLVGGLALGAAYELLQDHLRWVVEDNYGQSLIESRDVVTPNNTQDLNVFSTGPSFSLPLGPQTAVLLQGRWSDVSYQKSDFGNTRLSGLVGLRRQLGERSSLSVNATTEKVEYKDLSRASDYRIDSGYVDWTATGAKTELRTTAGYSRLAEQTADSSGATYSVSVVRDLTSRAKISLYAGHGFGDSADALKRDQGIRGITGGDRPAVISSDPMKSDYATLAWDYGGPRSRTILRVDWRQEAHERVFSLDRTSWEGELRFSRRLSSRFGVEFFAEFLKEDYSNSDIRFNEWGSGVGLRWEYARGFAIAADYSHLVGDGDTSQGANTRDYAENRYALRLAWTPDR